MKQTGFLKSLFGVCAGLVMGLAASNVAVGQDFMNPAHPLSPLNPASPLSIHDDDDSPRERVLAALRAKIAEQQVRAVIADGRSDADDIREAFLVRLSEDRRAQKASFPGMERSAASFIGECRQQVLGNVFVRSASAEQVTGLMSCMNGKAHERDKKFTGTFALFLAGGFVVGGAAAAILRR